MCTLALAAGAGQLPGVDLNAPVAAAGYSARTVDSFLEELGADRAPAGKVH